MKPKTIVAYVPGNTVLTTVLKDGKCIYSGNDFNSLKQEYPEVVCISFEKAFEQIEIALLEKYHKPDPVSVTLEEFYRCQNTGFPAYWEYRDKIEIFQCSEFIEACYTPTYIRLGDRDNACFAMTHLLGELDSAIERVKAFLEKS